MSSATGYFRFTKSVDFDCNYEALLTALNDRDWCSGSTKWEIVYQEGTPVGFRMFSGFFGELVQYPTVYPKKVTAVIILDENDEEVTINDFTDEQAEDALDFVEEDEPIKSLIEHLSPHILSGWFEISCYAVEGSYSYIESFSLNSSGLSGRQRQSFEAAKDAEYETYKLN